MNKIILSFLVLLFTGNTFSQTIMTVNGEDVDVSEFKRKYEKAINNPNYSKQSVNKYLDVFTEYKLKLADAKAKGLAQNPELLREIAVFEESLIQDEFDHEMMNNLLFEVKNRLNEEICAKHILLDVRKKASPDDTLFVYNKALRLRNELMNGADFNQYVKKYSADIDTKYSGGDLGCFSALQVSSYNLENAVYDLYPGQYSMPVRSAKGYHIVQVTDRRASNGMVTATQLFARANETQDQELNFAAERKIKQAHYQLTQGKDFNEVIVDFLENDNDELQLSKDEIDWFTVGTYESDFENAIFALQVPEQYSEPVKTSLGWHIFRLNERKPLPEFNKIEGNIRDAIMEDERYLRSKIKYANRLKAQYDYKKEDDNVKTFVREVSSGIGIKGWQTPSMYDYSKILFTIGNRAYSAQNFVDYVREQHTLGNFYDFDYYYKVFESDKVLDYHRKNFLKESTSLSSNLEEFKEGLLLAKYDDLYSNGNSNVTNTVVEKVVEPKFTVNSPEVKAYYQNNKRNYSFEREVVVKKYSASLMNKKEVDRLKAFSSPGKGDFFARLSLKKNKPQPVKILQLPINEALINGVDHSKIGSKGTRIHNGHFEYYVTVDEKAGEPSAYDEVSNIVLEDYLKEMATPSNKDEEKEIVRQVRPQDKYPYPVTINEKVVENLYR